MEGRLSSDDVIVDRLDARPRTRGTLSRSIMNSGRTEFPTASMVTRAMVARTRTGAWFSTKRTAAAPHGLATRLYSTPFDSVPRL